MPGKFSTSSYYTFHLQKCHQEVSIGEKTVLMHHDYRRKMPVKGAKNPIKCILRKARNYESMSFSDLAKGTD